MKFKNILVFSVCILIAVFSVVALTGYSSSGQSAENAESPAPWATRCDKNKAGKITHCEMYHRLVAKGTKERVVEFAIGYSKNNNSSKVASGIIILPLGIKLQDDVIVSIDGKEAFRARVDSCAVSGCYLFVTLSEQMLSKLKKGNEAAIMFKVTNKKYMKINMSLSGFTKALKKIS